MTAAEIKRFLNLQSHPREGGWYVRTYESPEFVAPEHFADRRYAGPRRTSTAIYYLLEPDTFSEMHLLESDEIFHHYCGVPVEMLQLLPDGSTRTVVIGADFSVGQRPQVVVPRGVWQGSRLLVPHAADAFALLGCTVSPGFEFEDYRSATRAELTAKWPEVSDVIAALTRA